MRFGEKSGKKVTVLEKSEIYSPFWRSTGSFFFAAIKDFLGLPHKLALQVCEATVTLWVNIGITCVNRATCSTLLGGYGKRPRRASASASGAANGQKRQCSAWWSARNRANRLPGLCRRRSSASPASNVPVSAPAAPAPASGNPNASG